MNDYWDECIRIAFEEAGIEATDDQINIVVGAVAGAYENIGMATYIPSGPSQAEKELQELKKEIEKQRIWEVCTSPCKLCNTTGTVTDIWGRPTICPKCDGKGRVKGG